MEAAATAASQRRRRSPRKAIRALSPARGEEPVGRPVLAEAPPPRRLSRIQSRLDLRDFEFDPRKAFKPRSSMLDPHNLFASNASMRGFVSIFWVFIFYQFGILLFHNYQTDGTLMPLTIAKVFFSDSKGFWINESLLISVTYLGFAIQRLVVWAQRRQVRALTPSGPVYWILRVLLEGTIIVAPIAIAMQRGWHPIQRGSFLLHSLAMCMKVHSFLSINSTQATFAHLTFADYTNFLLAPTLMYCTYYPRTERIRPWFIVEKLIGMCVSGIMLYLTVENYVYPVLAYDLDHKRQLTIIEAMIPLFPALLATSILMFILTFECILNILAELSRFADRHFYADWWNRYE